jgi:hypothetical protein
MEVTKMKNTKGREIQEDAEFAEEFSPSAEEEIATSTITKAIQQMYTQSGVRCDNEPSTD